MTIQLYGCHIKKFKLDLVKISAVQSVSKYTSQFDENLWSNLYMLQVFV